MIVCPHLFKTFKLQQQQKGSSRQIKKQTPFSNLKQHHSNIQPRLFMTVVLQIQQTYQEKKNMGISVSESNAIKEIEQNSRSKRSACQDIIRSQLASGVPYSKWKKDQKENVLESSPAHKIGLSYFGHERDSKEDENGEQGGVRQNKQIAGNSSSERVAVVATGLGVQNDEFQSSRIEYKAQINQIADTYATPIKVSAMPIDFQPPTTVPKSHDPNTVDTNYKFKKLDNPISLNKMTDVQAVLFEDQNEEQQKKSKKGKVNVLEQYAFKRTKNNPRSSPKISVKETKKTEFDYYDWTIPGEEGLASQMMRRDQLPSMNLVLSNKFNQNMNNFQQLDDRQSFSKNRRKLMRDLLMGNRDKMDQGTKMPSCGNLPSLCS